MDSNEREELDALVRSDGWRVFTAFVSSEWGPGGRAFIDAVTKAADRVDNQQATDHLRQIMAAQKIVQRLITWPSERLKALAPAEFVAADSLASHSRRGGL